KFHQKLCNHLVLQKLGKADETKDEQFEEYVQNFKRQEAEGSRLQREMRAYLTAIKGMQEASMKLTESLHEVYEPDWYGRDDVKMVGEKCDTLWEDFHQKLVDGALITLDTYLGQFPDIKNRIAKRSRKLVDYDSARHHLESLQNAKRKDEGRISKAEEEFQKAQKVFEDFNIDLQEELPSLWSRRIGFYVNTFQNISGLEAKFHKEITVVNNYQFVFSLLSDSGPLRIAKTPSPPEEVPEEPSPLASPNHTLAPVSSPAPARPKSPSQLRKGPPVPPLPKLTPSKELQQENIISFFEDNFVPEINVTTPSQEITCIPSVVIEPASNHEDEHDNDITIEVTEAVEEKFETDSTLDSTVEQSHSVSNDEADSLTTSQSKPEGFLYKAEALHDFEAANEDELNLKRGDIVIVITSVTAADQEAGWLTGVRETDWLQHKDAEAYKGLFPENFTRRLD
uniref:Amphiphysin n=1 Tax=Xenopus tropicalis TaxID=8364 RepID=A0A5S6NZ53_XENTR